MNHASIQTTSRYLHADEQMMRAAVVLLPDLLENTVPPTKESAK